MDDLGMWGIKEKRFKGSSDDLYIDIYRSIFPTQMLQTLLSITV